MIIDLKTLFLVTGLLNLFFVVILILFWKTQKTYRGFTQWVISQSVLAFSYILYVQRGSLPDFLTVIASNTLFIIAAILMMKGIFLFLGKDAHVKTAYILPIIVLAGFTYYSVLKDSLAIRNLFISAALLRVFIRIITVMLKNMPRKQKSLYRFVIVMFIIHSVLLTSRACWLFNAPEGTTLFSPAPLNSIYFIFTIIFYCSVSFSYIMWNHSRLNEELVQSNIDATKALEEKELLLQELNHRTKNNLQIISSMVRLRAAGITDAKTIMTIRDIESRIETLSLVYRKLNQTGSIAQIPFDEYIRDLADIVLQTFHRSDSVTLSLSLEPVIVPVDTAISAGIVINEIITNSIKHAFSPYSNGTIRIHMYMLSHDRINLELSDNGSGIPEGFDSNESASFGMKIIRSIIESRLGGKVTAATSGGLHWKMEFNAK